ncbi:PBSX family phage terminase large subunit [uncultured Parabacteroides sp.]|jgi:PBSX family phage terminase large subunit|uniref:PBSX family phage terminase large subunit n=1 Tax=uncultured Parabacteroides sp. TaxID=512312 RepID=UPI002619835F|nr:PBSX family phage terminase large subunit [uncultured Parabacteroides sp.]
MDKKVISYKRFNPNFHHLRLSLRDDAVRFIFLYGGSSSSKSYSIAQAIILECIQEGFNTMVYRKTGATISDSIYKTFWEAVKGLKLDAFFKPVEGQIRCFNGSYITFKGLDDPEKIKGLESYQYVFCEEVSEFDETDFKQIRKRLRGRKGQKIISAFNPISEDHWVKKNIFDKEKLLEVDNHLEGKLKDNITGKVLGKEYSEIAQKWTNSAKLIFNPRTQEYDTHNPDMVIMRSTYLNNFWVVGSPDGTYGFYDAQVIADFEKDKINDYSYYLVYALGEWGTIKTGGEFFRNFEIGKHVGRYEYNENYPIHITIDNNVLPYISIGFWQIITGNVNSARQIHEIPAEEPFNTVSKASEAAVTFLNDIGHKDKIFLYGDVSTKSGNTIDDDKLSFFDKFKAGLEKSFVVEERMPKTNPSVAMSGEFINAIYAGVVKSINIGIDESCKVSINDYSRVKKDVNGAILKQRIKNKETGQTYEQYGHFSDTKRYFITEAFNKEYTKFSLRRGRNKIPDSAMKYYDKSKVDLSKGYGMVEINPSINSKFVFVRAMIKDGDCYVVKAMLSDTIMGESEISSLIASGDRVQAECDPSLAAYVRNLRIYIQDVRGRKPFPDPQKRISAHMDYICNNIFIPSDYDTDILFEAFIENILDYKDKNNIEAINSLAALSERVKRGLYVA